MAIDELCSSGWIPWAQPLELHSTIFSFDLDVGEGMGQQRQRKSMVPPQERERFK